MPNNPDIPETGRIQRDPSMTGKKSDLEYATNERFDENLGATIGQPPDDPATDKAMRDAAAASKATRRGKIQEEKIPNDPLDPEFGADKIPER